MISSSPDSFLPSSVQIAPWASQSVVAGSTMVDIPVGVRADADLPPDVAGPIQPPRLRHFTARHRERVVPQGHIAQRELLAETQLRR